MPPPTLRRASLRRAAATALAAAALALAIAPARLARAAPCCISATSFGVGRLLIWEDFAVGVQLGHTRYLGEYDASGALRLHPDGYHEGLSQLQPWAIVRVNKRIQVEGWVPRLLNDRTSDGTRQIAGGLGDVGALAVEDSGRAAVFMDGETRYLASLNFTADPKVGQNPVVVTLHASQDMMMTFAAVTDASLSMDPQMPAMGHGAPDSVQPKATTLGRYEGQLSFTMTGTWETTVTVSRGGKLVGTPRFTTTF